MNATIKPFAPPEIVDDVYSDDQYHRLVTAVRTHGPWKLVMAHHFTSPEQIVATQSGELPDGEEVKIEDFISPNFRGFLAQDGVCYYPEIEDIFYNADFLSRARSYWGAKYARPELMLFNIQGAASSPDPGHIDGATFRGMTYSNTPVWLMNMMAKSGLFSRWMVKKTQVITWFYKGRLGGGFSYWPDGHDQQPKRLGTPIWNRGVVVSNEMMYHRGESNGPQSRRHPDNFKFHSVFSADGDSDWKITTDGEVIQKVSAKEVRFLAHWNAEVYMDKEEMNLVMDHKDDLNPEKVINMFIDDMRASGQSFSEPTDPMNDKEFIRLLTNAYDIGLPQIYPPEALGPGNE